MKKLLFISIVQFSSVFAYSQIDTMIFRANFGVSPIVKTVLFEKNLWKLDQVLQEKLWILKADTLDITLNIMFFEREKEIAGKKNNSKISPEDYLKLKLDGIYEKSKLTEKDKFFVNDSIVTKSKIVFDISNKMLLIQSDNITDNKSIVLAYLLNKEGVVCQMVFSGRYQNDLMSKYVQEFIEKNVIDISLKLNDNWSW